MKLQILIFIIISICCWFNSLITETSEFQTKKKFQSFSKRHSYILSSMRYPETNEELRENFGFGSERNFSFFPFGNFSNLKQSVIRLKRKLNESENAEVDSSFRYSNIGYGGLSKNISATLENLLKNYNNHERPGLKEGKVTTIKVNMLIKSMGPITEKEMVYSMDCYVRQEWHDDRLKFQGPLEQLTLDIKMLEAVWKPDTYFHNGHLSYVHTITRPNKLVRIDQNGNILYSMRLTIEAKCPMDLKNFPMDKQSCPLLIGSFAYTENEVRYEWEKERVSFVAGMTLSQYDLLKLQCQNYSARWRKGGIFSILRVNFILQRHMGYFLIEVYIPCVLIVVLSWVSFWINREATSDRVGLGITTVLTLSTIGLDTRTDLPKVHYATALDRFILMSFGYCSATVLQFAAVHYFTKIGSGENENDDDEWTDIETEEYLGNEQNDEVTSTSSHIKSADQIFVTENSCKSEGSSAQLRPFYHSAKIHPKLTEEEKNWTLLRHSQTQTDRHDSFWLQFINCITGNEKYRRDRTNQAMRSGSRNSVSNIDTISKILYPLSYILLNLWYWFSYYHTEIEYFWVEAGFDNFDITNVN